MTDWRVTNLLVVALLAEARLPSRLPAAVQVDSLGDPPPAALRTRVLVVDAPDDSIVIRPPPPGERWSTCRLQCATRCAFRSRVSRSRHSSRAVAGRRSSSSRPTLPLPGALHDPRQVALAAASAELERIRHPDGEADAARRVGTHSPAEPPRPRGPRHRLAGVRAPVPRDGRDPRRRGSRARRARPAGEHPAPGQPGSGRHRPRADRQRRGDGPPRRPGDAARSDRAGIATGGRRVLAARDRRLPGLAARASSSSAGSPTRVPVIGASLVLNQPRLTGAARGYPYDAEALERIARSPVRRSFGAAARLCPRQGAQVDPLRAEGGRCLRGATLRRARGGPAARGRGALGARSRALSTRS